MGKSIKMELVEVIGPGGRIMVPMVELDSYLKLEGFSKAPVKGEKVEPDVKSARAKLSKPIVPSSKVIQKMSGEKLKRLVDELDITEIKELKVWKYGKVSEKRDLVDDYLDENYRSDGEE